MSRRANPRSSSPIAFPGWPTVLGLAERGGGEWDRVRGAQLDVVRRAAPLTVIANLLAVATFAFAMSGAGNRMIAIVWAAIAAVVTAVAELPKLRDRGVAILVATRKEFHRETFWSGAMGAVWLGGIALMLPRVPAHTFAIGWVVVTCLMAGASVVKAPLPLAIAARLTLMGAGLIWVGLRLGDPLLSAVALLFTAILVAGAFFAGRTFVLHEAAEDALADKNEVVSLLLREFDDGGGDWMWQTDPSKCLTHVSSRFAFAMGVEPDALNTRPILQVLAGEAWEAGNFAAALREVAEKLKRREPFSDIILPVVVGGETHWWELSGAPRHDERGTFLGFRGVGSDVTAQRRSAEKINHMARYDTLTGLPNRLQLTEALAEAMAEAERWRGRCAFLMIDLDRFKAVNDTLGHPVGDRLLTRVAERLSQIVTGKDVCGRLGGDEFAVVLFDATDPARVNRMAAQIIEVISRPYEVDHHTLYIGASVGSATGPRDGRSVEMLIRSADLALYRSKDQSGGVHNVYEPQLHKHAEERRVLEIALRGALEKKELEIYYQPVVGAENATVESFEALLRWTNPQLGPISPARFVPIAEEARLIGPIGEWVLRQACVEATKWPETVRVAVNVSAEQLADGNFVGAVVSALAHSRLSPHRLELEVTESVFMREGTGAVATLEKLLGLGVRLALDDFGTGYSSLGYLSRTRFSTIKIDRSFVTNAAKNVPEALAIIRAVVAMADSLGMSTTAEGVETDVEYQLVRRLGCRKVQGYLFGRPMAANDAGQLFEAQRSAVTGKLFEARRVA